MRQLADRVIIERAELVAEVRPSKWSTLRALRVLDWHAAREQRP